MNTSGDNWVVGMQAHHGNPYNEHTLISAGVSRMGHCLNLVLLLFLIPATSFSQTQVEIAFPNLTFDKPLDLQHSPDGSNRLFVVERDGIIYVLENDQEVTEKMVFLNISDRVISFSEMGLLGLAFHPDYQNNGYFYVDYVADNPRRTVIARYSASATNPDSADKSSEVVILEIEQPAIEHNGGQIAFGPEGYLYIAMGDGGPGRDPNEHGQNMQTLLGSLLRIDVNNPMNGKNYGIPADNPFVGNTQGYKEEIFAYGLRNPWRFSFDPVTGWLWLGDDVYRGTQFPFLYGKYIYADFRRGTVWSLEYDGINPPVNSELLQMGINSVASFGVDQNNELYLCSFDGKIYRFAVALRVDEPALMPQDLALRQNYPNPFNPETTIQFDLPAAADMSLVVYDLLGREVARLAHGYREAGHHSLQWKGTDQFGNPVASGLYFYRLQTGGSVETKKMVLLW